MRRAFGVLASAALLCLVFAVPAGAATSSARDDNATVCAAAGKHISDGLEQFVEQMGTVSTQATSGDLTGAEATLKQAGATLVTISGNLTTDAGKADDQQLKTAVTGTAAEFQRLGGSLNSLSDLQNFDANQLDAQVTALSKQCGTTPGVLPTDIPTPAPTG